MNGVELARKYSWVCERARLFRISEKLRKGVPEAKRLLILLASYRWYKLIAELNGIRNPFNFKVVSFYWKGYPKLKGELFHNFTTLLPIFHMPMKYIKPEMVDECFIHPAKVREVKGEKVLVSYVPVVKKRGRLGLNSKPREILVKSDIAGLKVGDWIMIHFNTAIEKIMSAQARNLLGITKSSLERFNNRAKKRS